MKLYTLVCAFTVNYKADQPLLLTVKDEVDKLPLLEAHHPTKYQHELFHQLKTLFLPDTIKISTDVTYNYIDVANQYAIDYCKETYDIDDDSLIVTYGGVINHWPTQDTFQWSKYGKKEQFQGYSSSMTLNLLLDMVISRANV